MNFNELPIAATLQSEILAKGYTEATPVQAAILDEAHREGDLLVSSQTGSGKTLAFGLSLAPHILEENGTVRRIREPRALVVAPTRELALQVASELQWIFAKAGGRVATCVGGMDVRREERSLYAGAEIVVGTPGRVCDHIDRGTLKLGVLSVVVLDEADEMLNMGFREELEKILTATPQDRRTLMFSATFPKPMEQLARKYTKEPKRIRATDLQTPHQDIEYIAHLVAPREREHAVVNILRFYDAESALVFCATRDGVAHLHGSLVERGFAAVGISGELSQAERNRALNQMREGRARVMVATDVAARGLDLPAIGLVIHGDMPHDASVLQHRSGRTGRAGRKGIAVVLVPFPRRRTAEFQFKDARIPAKFTPVPTSEQIRVLDQQRVVKTVTQLATELEPDDAEGGRLLLEQLPAETLAAVLARSLRRTLPAPEELPQTYSGRPDRPPREDRREPRGTSFRNERPERGDRPERGARPERPRRGPDDAPPARDGERTPARRAPRGDSDEFGSRDGNGVWFRVNVGREQRADPKWLLPMLCRRGKITKAELGPMKIGNNETRFSIAPDAARRFEEAARRPDAKDPHIRIEPL